MTRTMWQCIKTPAVALCLHETNVSALYTARYETCKTKGSTNTSGVYWVKSDHVTVLATAQLVVRRHLV
jgi:hypothetical protein